MGVSHDGQLVHACRPAEVYEGAAVLLLRQQLSVLMMEWCGEAGWRRLQSHYHDGGATSGMFVSWLIGQ